MAPGNSGHQEENRGVAKGGEDTSKVLLLRPPLKRAPLSTPPTQTTLYDIESAFGTYIIPSLESKFRYDVITSQVSFFSEFSSPFCLFGFSNVQILIFCGSRRRCKTANYPLLHFRDMSGSSSGGLRNDDSKVEVIFLVAI